MARYKEVMVRLSEEELEFLRSAAARDDRSMAGEIRHALRFYFKDWPGCAG